MSGVQHGPGLTLGGGSALMDAEKYELIFDNQKGETV